jgi:cytochrome c-type biogenesis protein
MLSFLSPCVLPLVPAYVSMVSGLSAAEIEAGEQRISGPAAARRPRIHRRVHRRVHRPGSGGVGPRPSPARPSTGFVIGPAFVIVILGLWLTGVGTPRLFMRERRFHPRPSRLGVWAPPVMGMAFAFGWTPCIGPVLGGVLGLAATRATLASGLLLLVSYSLGLGVPFLATGLAFGHLTEVMARVRRRLGVVNAVAGRVLVAFGVLLLTDNLHWLSSAASHALGRPWVSAD